MILTYLKINYVDTINGKVVLSGPDGDIIFKFEDSQDTKYYMSQLKMGATYKLTLDEDYD